MPDVELPTTLAGLAGLSMLVVGNWIQQRKSNSKISDVHEQVQNTHPKRPNLRDDLDAMERVMRDGFMRADKGFRDMTTEMDCVREDLGHERQERRRRDADLARQIQDCGGLDNGGHRS